MRRVSRPTAESLSDDDVATIKRCLTAVVDGPCFPDWEFEALFGLTRPELCDVLGAWPKLPDQTPPEYDSPEQYQRVAVGSALNNLLGYPYGVSDDTFARAVGVPRERVVEVYKRWRSGVSAFAQPRPVETDPAPRQRRFGEVAILSFVYGLAGLLLLACGIMIERSGTEQADVALVVLLGVPFLLMFPAIGLGIGGVLETKRKPHLRGRICAIIGLVSGGLLLAVGLLVLLAISQMQPEF